MNDHDHAVIPPALQSICDSIPEFGPFVQVKIYQNADDTSRVISMMVPRSLTEKPIFFSKIGMMTNKGPVEVGFIIQGALTIEEAALQWKSAAQKAILEVHENMIKNQKRILVPEVNAPFPKKLSCN